TQEIQAPRIFRIRTVFVVHSRGEVYVSVRWNAFDIAKQREHFGDIQGLIRERHPRAGNALSKHLSPHSGDKITFFRVSGIDHRNDRILVGPKDPVTIGITLTNPYPRELSGAFILIISHLADQMFAVFQDAPARLKLRENDISIIVRGTDELS